MLIESEKINLNSKYTIFIYGGDAYSKGKKEHDPPHFHLKYDNKEVTIKIPTVDEWYEEKKLTIDRGIISPKILNFISEYVDLKYKKENFTIIEYIRYMWNQLNLMNDITTLFDKIYLQEASSIPSNKSIKDIKSIIIKEFEDFKIIVKGGDDYGKEINVLTKPHFYIEIDGAELKALIPTLKDWKTKEFIPSGEKYDIFIGLPHIHDQIIEYFHNINNLKFIQNQWNDLNKNNNFIEKF